MNKVTENIPVNLSFSLVAKESIHNFFRRKMIVRVFTFLPDLFFKQYKELAKLILKCHETFEKSSNSFPTLINTIYGGDKLSTLKTLEANLSAPKLSVPTRFIITTQDSLEAARETKKHHKTARVGILNFGNRHQPCGVGLAPYGGSQEEFLARRSNLAWALDPRFSKDVHDKMKTLRLSENYKDDHFAHHIPYFGTVVTQNVSFIDGKTPDQFDIISSAAPDLRKNSDEYLHLKQFGAHEDKARKKILEHKIRAVLASAIASNIKHLVLGAYGCGCFLNDTREVAKVFEKVLTSKRYENQFETITFAITDKEKMKIFQPTIHDLNHRVT